MHHSPRLGLNLIDYQIVGIPYVSVSPTQAYGLKVKSTSRFSPTWVVMESVNIFPCGHGVRTIFQHWPIRQAVINIKFAKMCLLRIYQ